MDYTKHSNMFYFIFFLNCIYAAPQGASIRTNNYSALTGGGFHGDIPWIDLMTVLEIANSNPDLSKLREIYDATELGFKIEQSRHITVFMPNNKAIEKELAKALPNMAYDDLLKIFQTHILSEVVKISELKEGVHKVEDVRSIPLTLHLNQDTPENLTIILNDGSSHNVSVTEIENANGVAYIIDHILLTEHMRQKIKDAEKSTASNRFSVPDHIAETNLHHWFYGRFGGTPIEKPNEDNENSLRTTESTNVR